MRGFGSAELLGWTVDAVDQVERERGWTESAIERLELGWAGSNNRPVVIPVRDDVGTDLGELHYDPTGRHHPKMVAGAGTPRALFPPPEMIDDGELVDRVVWLVEGEPDAIRLWSLGLAAIAVPGAQNWKDEWAARLTGRRWKVVVCFDCDEPGRTGAARAADAIVNQGGDARVLDLDPARDDGFDLTDWLGLATDDELRRQAARGLTDMASTLELHDPRSIDHDSGNGARPLAERSVELTIVSLPDFAGVEEPGANAILGTGDSAVIPEGGDAMVYGDGGVGKTTLAIDLACHLGAGDDWLGLSVPRPFRVLLIENEGPRPLFRRKLDRKRTGWTGSPLEDRVQVLEEPWGKLTFADPAWQVSLAGAIAELSIDVLVAGPVTSAGMEAAGTIQEVRAFLHLVDQVRELSGRPIAVILVHHQNRAGKVSGAWEGVGDTLIHVQQQGHARLRLYFQKARWASEQHATTLQLEWAAGDSFELVLTEPENRAEASWDAIEAFVLAHGDCSWNDVLTARDEEGEKLVRGDARYLGHRRDSMLEAGILFNSGTGSSFKLWHRDDPARPLVTSDEPGGRHLRAVDDPEDE